MPSATLERVKFEAGANKAPQEAFRFKAAETLQLAQAADGAKVVPVTILARTPDVVDHWYFGPCIHDMAGARFKKKVPIDWCHWHDLNVGYADNIVADEKTGLTLSGKIISLRDDDMAAEIIGRGKLGVPYEFSIEAWVPWRLEFLAEGMTAECNGQTIEGPCLIFREWTFKGGGVCPFGVDGGTSTNFSPSGGRRESDAPRDVEFILFSEPNAMAKQAATTDTKQATDPPAEGQQLSTDKQNPPAVSSPAEDPAKAFAAKLAQFTAKFGDVNGSKWAAAGKSYEEALELHAAELSAQLKTQTEASGKKIEELEVKLAAVDKGELMPVSGGDSNKPTVPSGLELKLGSNLAKVANSLKIPGAKA